MNHEIFVYSVFLFDHRNSAGAYLVFKCSSIFSWYIITCNQKLLACEEITFFLDIKLLKEFIELVVWYFILYITLLCSLQLLCSEIIFLFLRWVEVGSLWPYLISDSFLRRLESIKLILLCFLLLVSSDRGVRVSREWEC